MLRTFIYDTNTLDNTFSGSYTAGRLVAVQHTAFTPGQSTSPNSMQFIEMYNYNYKAALVSGKRLQVLETFPYGGQNFTRTTNLDAAYTYDPEGKMTSVNYPTTYSFNGTQLVANPGPTYTYSFDAMDRPTGLKDQSNNTAVSGVSYNPANQLLAISYFGTNESRQYNNLNQMTNLTIGSEAITYTFPAGTNNGKISQQSDSVSGETVTYQYDSLNRLLSGTSNQGWSETYGFDGFGNLVSKTPTGGAPTLSQAVSATTNRIVGQNYDANGNQTSSAAGTLGYDAENRLQTAAGVQYAYDSRNKRIWRGTLDGNGNLTAQEVYFYGVDGQKLGTYPLVKTSGSIPYLTDNTPTLAVFFGGKRVGITSGGTTSSFKQNRLGSNQGFQFYPYGEARGTPPADTVGFATYTHDSATGLDYADQRYYANNFGRFMSPDPHRSGATRKSPGTWNRYAYVMGDPANLADPVGLYASDCGDGSCDEPPPCTVPVGGDGLVDPGSEGDGSPDCPPATPEPDLAPPCWMNTGNIYQTLLDIGANIMEIVQQKIPSVSAPEYSALQTLIQTDTDQEFYSILDLVWNQQAPRGPNYIGGHFNLYLSENSLEGVLSKPDLDAFTRAFGGTLDGTRQGAVFGNPKQGNYTLHSKELDRNRPNDRFDFHFDQFNPFDFKHFGFITHFFGDVIGGHIGTPCLDPAWAI